MVRFVVGSEPDRFTHGGWKCTLQSALLQIGGRALFHESPVGKTISSSMISRKRIMPIALTLDRQTHRFVSNTIRVGTAPDNEMSLPQDPRVEPVHAVFKSVNGRWMVESCGREQVRIGNRRPVPFAWLNPGDVIPHAGSNGTFSKD